MNYHNLHGHHSHHGHHPNHGYHPNHGNHHYHGHHPHHVQPPNYGLNPQHGHYFHHNDHPGYKLIQYVSYLSSSQVLDTNPLQLRMHGSGFRFTHIFNTASIYTQMCLETLEIHPSCIARDMVFSPLLQARGAKAAEKTANQKPLDLQATFFALVGMYSLGQQASFYWDRSEVFIEGAAMFSLEQQAS